MRSLTTHEMALALAVAVLVLMFAGVWWASGALAVAFFALSLRKRSA